MPVDADVELLVDAAIEVPLDADVEVPVDAPPQPLPPAPPAARSLRRACPRGTRGRRGGEEKACDERRACDHRTELQQPPRCPKVNIRRPSEGIPGSDRAPWSNCHRLSSVVFVPVRVLVLVLVLVLALALGRVFALVEREREQRADEREDWADERGRGTTNDSRTARASRRFLPRMALRHTCVSDAKRGRSPTSTASLCATAGLMWMARLPSLAGAACPRRVRARPGRRLARAAPPATSRLPLDGATRAAAAFALALGWLEVGGAMLGFAHALGPVTVLGWTALGVVIAIACPLPAPRAAAGPRSGSRSRPSPSPGTPRWRSTRPGIATRWSTTSRCRARSRRRGDGCGRTTTSSRRSPSARSRRSRSCTRSAAGRTSIPGSTRASSGSPRRPRRRLAIYRPRGDARREGRAHFLPTSSCCSCPRSSRWAAPPTSSRPSCSRPRWRGPPRSPQRGDRGGDRRSGGGAGRALRGDGDQHYKYTGLVWAGRRRRRRSSSTRSAAIRRARGEAAGRAARFLGLSPARSAHRSTCATPSSRATFLPDGPRPLRQARLGRGARRGVLGRRCAATGAEEGIAPLRGGSPGLLRPRLPPRLRGIDRPGDWPRRRGGSVDLRPAGGGGGVARRPVALALAVIAGRRTPSRSPSRWCRPGTSSSSCRRSRPCSPSSSTASRAPRAGRRRRAALCAASLAWGAGGYAHLWTRQPTLAWLAGRLSIDDARAAMLPESYVPMRALEALVPPTGRVALVWMRGYTYYLRRPYVLDSVFEEWRIAGALEAAAGSAAFAGALAARRHAPARERAPAAPRRQRGHEPRAHRGAPEEVGSRPRGGERRGARPVGRRRAL